MLAGFACTCTVVEWQLQEAHRARCGFSVVFFKSLDSREALIQVSFPSCPCQHSCFPHSLQRGSKVPLQACQVVADPVGDIRVPNAVKTVLQPHLKLAVPVFPDNKQHGSWWMRSWGRFYQRVQTLPVNFGILFWECERLSAYIKSYARNYSRENSKLIFPPTCGYPLHFAYVFFPCLFYSLMNLIPKLLSTLVMLDCSP